MLAALVAMELVELAGARVEQRRGRAEQRVLQLLELEVAAAQEIAQATEEQVELEV